MEAEGRARERSKPSLPKPRCTCASFHHVASVSGRPRSGSNPRTNRTPFLNLPSLPSNEEGRTPSRPFRSDALTGKVGEAVRDTREPHPRDLQSSEGNVSNHPPTEGWMKRHGVCPFTRPECTRAFRLLHTMQRPSVPSNRPPRMVLVCTFPSHAEGCVEAKFLFEITDRS